VTPSSAVLALAALSAAATACAPPAPVPIPAPASTAATATAPVLGGFLPADPAHGWSFPRDHFPRPGYRNEWWYFTGRLSDAGGRRLGFQVTFFRVGLLPAPPPLDSAWSAADVVMGHLAITDIAAGTHRFGEVVWRAGGGLAGLGAAPGPLVAWALPPPGTPGRWSLCLEGDTWRLEARDDGARMALSLAAGPGGPPVLQGPNGHSRKSALPGYASEYYSQPRLRVTGTVTIDGEARAVEGMAWLDREVGSSQLAPAQVGWDWLALRLADGRDLMLSLLRRADGAVDWRFATLSGGRGTSRQLPPEAWSAEATGSWTSPETGARYPAGWRVAVPGEGLVLDVRPDVAGAENRSRLLPALHYWEGPVTAWDRAGRPAGEGYAELTGHGEGSRPPL
jgi:predicted secreted hydrolase